MWPEVAMDSPAALLLWLAMRQFQSGEQKVTSG